MVFWVGPIMEVDYNTWGYNGRVGLAIAGVHPVNRHRGCMGVMRGRGLAEIFRLPGARIKFWVAIGSWA